MLADQQPHPRQRRCGGFVSRDDQRQDLVDQFFVAHAAIGLAVAAFHDHLQKIEVLAIFPAPILDYFVDQFAERAEAEGELEIAVLLFRHDLERIGAEAPLEPIQIGAENRAQHDLERELAGILGQIDRFIGMSFRCPASGELLVDLVDQAVEFIDHAAVERGLHHAALAAPKIAVARH